MGDVSFVPPDTASAVLALGKAAWRLGTSLSKLDHDAKPGDSALKNLAGEVKSLSSESDLIYAKLEEVASRSGNGSPPPYDGDGKIWNCLATQVRESLQTLQELELFVKSVRMEEAEETSLVYHPQHLVQLNKSKDQIEAMAADVHRHTENLRTTLLLIQTVLAHLAPYEADQLVEIEKLHHMVKKLQRSSQVGPPWRHSHTEATLLQYAHEAIMKGTMVQQAATASKPVAQSQVEVERDFHTPAWMETLQIMRANDSRPSTAVRNSPPRVTGETAHIAMRSAGPPPGDAHDYEAGDSDDDLDSDFAKAALDTGAQAFEFHDWEEADSLLQEGLRILQQLPKQRRAFCDIFDLHYKLAICAYHTQEPRSAEEALNSLVRQSVTSSEQRVYIHNATHLLSQLYIRVGQVDRARVECENALQARRRLLGKQSDASLESMALMAHIYVLLKNRPLAKSCLAMIPEARRDAVLRGVEESLGPAVEHLDFSSLLARAIPTETNAEIERARSRLSASTLGTPAPDYHGSDAGSVTSRSPAVSPWQMPRSLASEEAAKEDMQSFLKRSPPSAGESKEWGLGKTEHALPYPQVPLKATETSNGKTLSRKEILSKVGCQPRDRTEEAVCGGDHIALAAILNKKKGFWRSSVRKRGRPERVTALHFAALFGEVEMARRLVEASFNVNEVPFGYSTTLTPLNFAIGARQVAMVDFLTANGAKPAEPDTWSTLAAQLMSRSWLMKTMSESERDPVPGRIVAIMNILLQHGWLINAPIATSSNTVLHQAVTFWTGAYTWDLSLRGVVTSFLCERGADPFQANAEGKTPYDMASTSGHQDLVFILQQCSRRKELSGTSVMPVELPGHVQ